MKIVFCILMVGGLICQVNAIQKWDEQMLKKTHVCYISTNFLLNDFQKISAIIKDDTEIIGKNQEQKKEAGVEHNLPVLTDKVSAQWHFLTKPPNLKA